MGVEYAHGIFVADLTWRPTRRHVDAVCSILDRIFDRETDLPSGELPPNLVVSYAPPRGAHVVLDCGKDIPAFAIDGARLPSEPVVRMLARKLETALVEYGWYY